MPRKVVLSWSKSHSRWRKIYKGHQWFSKICLKSDVEACRLAVSQCEEWKKKVDEEESAKTEIEKAALLSSELQARIKIQADKLRWVAELWDRRGMAERAAGVRANIAELEQQPNLLRLYEEKPPLAIEPFAVERIRAKLNEKTRDQSKVLSVCAADFDESRQAELKEGKIGVSTYNNTKRNVAKFIEWIGGGATEAITEDTLPKYRAWLLSTMKTKRNAECYYNSCKQFLNFLHERNRIAELPRNFRSRALAFKVKYDNKNPWSKDHWKLAMEKAPERMRLYLLLMLNAGMYQGDIGQLLDNEVDWQKGVISRGRSKTNQAGTWQLWPETFRLLKRYRSGTSIVLLSDKGDRLYISEPHPETLKHVKRDDIGDWFDDWRKSEKLDLPNLMQLRKTAASAIDHEFGRAFSHAYLAHANRELEDKSYVASPDLTEAIKWLGEQFPVPENVPETCPNSSTVSGIHA